MIRDLITRTQIIQRIGLQWKIEQTSSILITRKRKRFKRYTEFMDNLLALFEISKKKKDGVTRNDLADYLKMRSQDIFEKRKFSRKYVKIVAGSGQTSPKKYYITDEGKRIVRLIYYFRDYYKERNQQIRMRI